MQRCAGCGGRISGLAAMLSCGHALCVPCHHASMYIARHVPRIAALTEHKSVTVMQGNLLPDNGTLNNVQGLVYEWDHNRFTLIGPHTYIDTSLPCGELSSDAPALPACPLPHCDARFHRRPTCQVDETCTVHQSYMFSIFGQHMHCRTHEIATGTMIRLMRTRVCVRDGNTKKRYFPVLILYHAHAKVTVRGSQCFATTKRGGRCINVAISGNGGYCRVHSRDVSRSKLAYTNVMSGERAYNNYSQLVMGYLAAADPERVVDLPEEVYRLYYVFAAENAVSRLTTKHLQDVWSAAPALV